VSLSSGDEVPHIFTRKSRLQLGELLITSAKRLLQHNLPESDVSSCSKNPLFDHLVCQHEEIVRHFNPERFGGLEIDDEFELGRFFDRDIAGLGPMQNLVSSGSSVSRYLGTGQFIPQPTAVTSAKPMPPAKFADRVASGALMIALPARHRRQ